MNKPMTTEEAREKYSCEECRDDGMCDWSCVESVTCSLNCPHCNERVWFQGNLGGKWNPKKFDCPYCNKEMENKYKEN